MPLEDGSTAEYMGAPLNSYDEYLARYDVLRKPSSNARIPFGRFHFRGPITLMLNGSLLCVTVYIKYDRI